MSDSQQKKFTDSGYAWVVTSMSFLTLYATAANILALGVLLPDLLSHFKVSQAMIGVLGSVKICVVDVTSGTLIGPLTRKVGCRPLTIFGLAFAALGCVLSAYVNDNFYWFVLTFSVVPGIGVSSIYIPSTVIVHQYNNKRRALASGLGSVGLSFGSFTFPILMQLTSKSFGWRAALVMLGAVQVQMIAAAMLFMPNPDLRKKPSPTPIHNKEDLSPICGNELSTPMCKKDTNTHAITKKRCCVDLTIFKNPAFILFLFGYPFCDAGITIFFSFALQRAVYQGISPVYASIVLSTFGGCSVLGRIFSGFIANLNCTRKDLQAAGCVLMAGIVCAFSITAGESLLLHLIFAACFGFLNGGYHSLFSTLLVDIVGLDELPRALGIVQLVKCVVGAISLPMAGYLFDSTQNYSATFLMAGVSMIGSSFLYAASGIVNRRRKLKLGLTW